MKKVIILISLLFLFGCSSNNNPTNKEPTAPHGATPIPGPTPSPEIVDPTFADDFPQNKFDEYISWAEIGDIVFVPVYKDANSYYISDLSMNWMNDIEYKSLAVIALVNDENSQEQAMKLMCDICKDNGYTKIEHMDLGTSYIDSTNKLIVTFYKYTFGLKGKTLYSLETFYEAKVN